MHFKAEQVFLPLKNTSILIISTNQGLFKYTQTTGGRNVNQKEKEYFKTFDTNMQMFPICTFHRKQHING